MSSQLEDVVRAVIADWVKDEVLFTALDVSNRTKETLPLARHREVRDIVRAEFPNMEVAGYARTPISVTLANQTVTQALLYHPLSDSWNLDSKYDDQQRVASSKAVTPVVVVPVTPAPACCPVTVTPVTTPVAAAPIASPVVPTNPNKHLWDKLFDTQVSLFPRR